jgi:hypothetical protein
MNKNQAYHLLQWSIYILTIIIILLFIPARYVWILLVLIGTAFTGAFILRFIKKYPGKGEPLHVDLLSGVISILLIIPYQFIEATFPILFIKIMTPPLILIPHFAYILKNKNIHPPGIVAQGRKNQKKQ